MTEDERRRLVSFTMPAPTALALSISLQAAKKADILKSELVFNEVFSAQGSARGVSQEQAGTLYDFFEQCMLTVTFAFNALEIFANQTIADGLKDEDEYHRETRRGRQSFNAEKAQRDLSTEEKLTAVLPRLLSTKNPREAPIWADFEILKRARDATIHMKSTDALRRAEPRERTLFHEFFVMPSLTSFPQFALGLLDYYHRGTTRPRWLDGADQLATQLSGKRPAQRGRSSR